MYKSLIFIGVSGLILALSGCSQKSPQPVSMSHTPSLDFSDTPSVTGDNANGKVSSNGKYMGQDGISRSGIKTVYFATDQYTLDPDQISRLHSDLPKIQALAKKGRLRIEGNTDEVGSDEYNHALGLKRAKSVMMYLRDYGIPQSKMDIVSYGESNPVCSGASAACHAKNRRVEINLAR